MLKRFVLGILLTLWASSAFAQGNPQCPTRPLGDSTNACASTAFVQGTTAANSSVTPYQYKAVGDGVANDSVPMQNWLNACAAAKLICALPPGTFNISNTTLTIPSGVSVLGGGEKAIIRRTVAANTAMMQGNNNIGTVLSNFVVSYVPPFSPVTISNGSPAVFTLANHGQLTSAAVFLKVSGGGTLPSPLLTTQAYYISPNGNTTNTFRVTATFGGADVITTTSGSGTFSVAFSGISEGIWQIDGTDNRISGVTVTGPLYVGLEDRNGTNDILEDNHIYGVVNRGLYPEATTTSTGVLVKGNSVNGTDLITGQTQFTAYCVNINAFGTGVVNSVAIESNKLLNCLGDGIVVADKTRALIRGNRIVNSGALSTVGAGIVVEDANGFSPITVDLIGNTVIGSYYGIEILNTPKVSSTGNTVTGSQIHNIWVRNSNDVTIIGGIASGSVTGDGVRIDTASANAIVVGVESIGNNQNGFYSDATTSNGTYQANQSITNGTAYALGGTRDLSDIYLGVHNQMTIDAIADSQAHIVGNVTGSNRFYIGTDANGDMFIRPQGFALRFGITTTNSAALESDGLFSIGNTVAGKPGSLKLYNATSGSHTQKTATGALGNSVITWPIGSTDFSSTGGTSQFVKQASAGAALTLARPACADLSDSGTACNSTPGTPNAVTFGTVNATSYSLGGNLALANTGGYTQLLTITSSHVAIELGGTGDFQNYYSNTLHSWWTLDLGAKIADMNVTRLALMQGTASTSKTTGTAVVTGGLGVSGATFTDTLNVITMANTATTSAVCYNTGTGLFTYDGTLGTCTVSDERLKNIGQPIQGALAKLLQIKGIYYTWKDPSFGKGNQIGVSAQAVERVFPELVQTDSTGRKSADYQRLSAPIIEAMRELDARIKHLERRK